MTKQSKQEQRSVSEQLGEPVAIVDANDDGYWADILPDRSVKVGQLLYTTPYVPTGRQPAPQRSEDTMQQKPWVGLTDKEINDLVHSHDDFSGLWEFADSVEAKLREKNSL